MPRTMSPSPAPTGPPSAHDSTRRSKAGGLMSSKLLQRRTPLTTVCAALDIGVDNTPPRLSPPLPPHSIYKEQCHTASLALPAVWRLRRIADTHAPKGCPAIVLAMGEKGALSRALNTYLSPVTHPALPVCAWLRAFLVALCHIGLDMSWDSRHWFLVALSHIGLDMSWDLWH